METVIALVKEHSLEMVMPLMLGRVIQKEKLVRGLGIEMPRRDIKTTWLAFVVFAPL